MVVLIILEKGFNYSKIQNISPGLIKFHKHIFGGLYSGGLYSEGILCQHYQPDGYIEAFESVVNMIFSMRKRDKATFDQEYQTFIKYLNPTLHIYIINSNLFVITTFVSMKHRQSHSHCSHRRLCCRNPGRITRRRVQLASCILGASLV